MPDAVYSATDWLAWAAESIVALDIVVNKPDEKMELVQQEEVEANPAEWLGYYNGWMSWFSACSYTWQQIYSNLDYEMQKILDRSAAINRGAKGGKAQTLCNNTSLSDAIRTAEMMWKKYITEFEVAQSTRDMVSRTITAMEKERRGRHV